MAELLFLVIVIAIALIFDFINGFHDAANSIATVVATNVLKPLHAVLLAAFWNFFGVFVFSVAVAKTVGKGVISQDIITLEVILAALFGAIIWNLITWYGGLPSSSSHALIGGLIGAGLISAGPGSIIMSGVQKILLFIILAPLMGFLGAVIFSILMIWVFRRSSEKKVNGYFRKLQIVSSSFYSLGHGMNDAQKTMGIITVALLSTGYISDFTVPFWVIISSYSAIALGTFSGGWRIVKTMGMGITKLKPFQGFSAETSGGLVLQFASWLGIPVSTTHVISGSIMGVGATARISAVRWQVARSIIWAWILTIPLSALMAAVSYLAIKVVV